MGSGHDDASGNCFGVQFPDGAYLFGKFLLHAGHLTSGMLLTPPDFVDCGSGHGESPLLACMALTLRVVMEPR